MKRVFLFAAVAATLSACTKQDASTKEPNNSSAESVTLNFKEKTYTFSGDFTTCLTQTNAQGSIIDFGAIDTRLGLSLHATKEGAAAGTYIIDSEQQFYGGITFYEEGNVEYTVADNASQSFIITSVNAQGANGSFSLKVEDPVTGNSLDATGTFQNVK